MATLSANLRPAGGADYRGAVTETTRRGSSRRFADLSGPEVGGALSATSILVQPLGAIEQHGPHLPMGTDSVIATAVAEATVERHGEELDLWLLPTLSVTKSNEHAWSPGTLWLSATTLLAVLDDIGRCIATTPARRLVFLNGHGGNSALVSVAIRDIRLRHGLMTFLAHPSVPADRGGESPAHELGMGIHGGTDETSLMLHLSPHLVHVELAGRRVPERLADNRHVRFGGSVNFGWLSDDFGPDGYIGDPTAATPERGAELFHGAVRGFAEALREVSTFDFGR